MDKKKSTGRRRFAWQEERIDWGSFRFMAAVALGIMFLVILFTMPEIPHELLAAPGWHFYAIVSAIGFLVTMTLMIWSDEGKLDTYSMAPCAIFVLVTLPAYYALCLTAPFWPFTLVQWDVETNFEWGGGQTTIFEGFIYAAMFTAAGVFYLVRGISCLIKGISRRIWWNR